MVLADIPLYCDFEASWPGWVSYQKPTLSFLKLYFFPQFCYFSLFAVENTFVRHWEHLFIRRGGQWNAGESKRDWGWQSGVWGAIWKIMPVNEMWKAEKEASSRAHVWKGLVMSTWRIFQLICLLGSLFTFLCLSWYTQQGQSYSVSNHRNFHFLIQEMCSWYHFYS